MCIRYTCSSADILTSSSSSTTTTTTTSFSEFIGDYNAGSFPAVLDDTFQADFKTYIKSMGREFTLKGKELFMPVRLALTGRTSGPDIGEQLKLVGLSTAAGVTTGVVGLEERIKVLSEINVKV